MGCPQAPSQQPPPKFLPEQLLFPAGTLQHAPVLLGPPDQVGDHLLQGAVGDGLIHGIAGLPCGESVGRVWLMFGTDSPRTPPGSEASISKTWQTR